jgi:hypothetical protein
LANGAIRQPPGIAARGLIQWAIDLWPYINGKALFNGLELREMEVSNMLDVLHFLFEDDLNYSTAEQAEAHGEVRNNMYSSLYGIRYKYYTPSKKRGSQSFSGGGLSTASGETFGGPEDDFGGPVKPFNPRKAQTKPYFPPTDLTGNASKPFGSVLDAPLGY